MNNPSPEADHISEAGMREWPKSFDQRYQPSNARIEAKQRIVRRGETTWWPTVESRGVLDNTGFTRPEMDVEERIDRKTCLETR